ncbi:MAG TPA: hypothetical protein VFB22_12315 [Candidatus Baltobacteraceae bacterium]|nr:hypothetical protein [Candidatus Baltobacteraceae bacterium]
MIPPDVLFRTAANAAAAAFANSPPYLAYRTEVTIDVPSMNRHKVIMREVETRTRDDYARLHDLPNGGTQYAHSFPLIPTFDAISYFRFQFNGSQRDSLSYVKEIQPITFTDPANTAHADVVVTMLRYYHASYAPDSTEQVAHILMDPLPTLTRGNDSDFYLHDVYVDTATNLPTRVVYEGPSADFSCDYTVVDNHWLVRHASYRQTFYGPLHIGRVTATAEATNSDFRFPATPSDPKLAQ